MDVSTRHFDRYDVWNLLVSFVLFPSRFLKTVIETDFSIEQSTKRKIWSSNRVGNNEI